MSVSIGFIFWRFVFLAPRGAAPPLIWERGGLSRRLERREMPGHRGLANKPPARRLPHRFRAHRLDPRRPFLDVAQALADRQGRTVPAREIRLAVAGVDRRGDHPGLGAPQVARANTVTG